MKHTALVVALLTVFASMPVPAMAGAAQVTTATIGGVVTDQTGGALPGATVTIKSLETDIVRTVITDADGRYRASGLEPGTYELAVELQGFQTYAAAGHPAQRRAECHAQRHHRRWHHQRRGYRHRRVADHRHDEFLDFGGRRLAADSRAAAQRARLQPVDTPPAWRHCIADDVAPGRSRDGNPGIGRRCAAEPDQLSARRNRRELPGQRIPGQCCRRSAGSRNGPRVPGAHQQLQRRVRAERRRHRDGRHALWHEQPARERLWIPA